MNLLFIHQAFPAQFGRLALELNRRYGWRCRFLIEDLSRCPTPTPEMLERLELHRIAIPAEDRDDRPTPWPQIHGKFLAHCRVRPRRREDAAGPRPDLVVAHGGRGCTDGFPARPARLPDHQLLRILLRLASP